MKKQKSPSDILLEAIESFLIKEEMPATVFGQQAANDSKLVFDLRAGRELRFATTQKIQSFMEKAA